MQSSDSNVGQRSMLGTPVSPVVQAAKSAKSRSS